MISSFYRCLRARSTHGVEAPLDFFQDPAWSEMRPAGRLVGRGEFLAVTLSYGTLFLKSSDWWALLLCCERVETSPQRGCFGREGPITNGFCRVDLGKRCWLVSFSEEN